MIWAGSKDPVWSYAFWRRGGKTHAELNKDGYHFILLLLSIPVCLLHENSIFIQCRAFKKLKLLLKGEKKPSDLLRNCKNIALDSHIFRIESPVVHILPFFALLLFSLSFKPCHLQNCQPSSSWFLSSTNSDTHFLCTEIVNSLQNSFSFAYK